MKHIWLDLLFIIALASACSNPTKFNLAEQQNGQTLNSNLLIEGGRYATNKTKKLSVEFVNLKGDYKTVRFAQGDSFDKAPSVPFVEKTTVDLVNGTEDGPLKFVAELTDGGGNTKVVKAAIFLDTYPPSGRPIKVLAQGQNGLVHFKLNDPVPVDVEAFDVPAPNGQASGLDALPLRIGYSPVADCSVNLTEVSGGWVEYSTGHFGGFKWPEGNPTVALYVCVFVRDRADNTATILSQPLNAPWQVIAGDNNQGNGGSVAAPNVRFNQPQQMAVDSQNNLYVSDPSFNTIRMIDGSGVIRSFAGNGQHGSLKAGNATATSLSNPKSLAFDSKDQLYIAVDEGIARIDKNHSIKVWMPYGGTNSLFIDRKTDTLYIAHFNRMDVVDSGSYIYKLDAKKDSATAADLVVVAGNGKTEPFQNSPILSGPALSTPLDGAGAVDMADDGSFYVATLRDGNGYNMGHHGVRRISFDANGVGTNTWIDVGMTSAASQIAYVHTGSGAAEEKYLLLATERGLYKTNLLGCAFPSQPCLSTAIIGDMNGFNFVRGVALDRPGNGKFDFIYASDSSRSQVVRFYPNFTKAGKWGRDVYNGADSIATQAMVNNPFGVASDSQGNVYFVDTLNGVLRKVDPQGTISLFSGSPGSLDQISPGGFEPVDFTQAKFFTLSFIYGYQFFLKYSPMDNSLYFADGGFAQRLRKFDLNTGKVNAFHFPANSPFAFTLKPPAGGETGPSITYGDVGTINPVSSRIVHLDGTAAHTLSVIAGNGQLAAPTDSDNALSVPSGFPRGSGYDAAGNYFFSDGGNIQRVSPDGKIKKLMTVAGYISDFWLFEKGGHHQMFALTDASKVSFVDIEDGIKRDLCITGSFLNNPGAINVASDGNLLISDTANSRVLKYYILDAGGNYAPGYCP